MDFRGKFKIEEVNWPVTTAHNELYYWSSLGAILKRAIKRAEQINMYK
jgi:hypothetical protein